MVKTSTLLYICDNLDEENEKVIDVDACTRKEEDEYEVVWQFLDGLLMEPDQNLVKKVLNQISQR